MDFIVRPGDNLSNPKPEGKPWCSCEKKISKQLLPGFCVTRNDMPYEEKYGIRGHSPKQRAVSGTMGKGKDPEVPFWAGEEGSERHYPAGQRGDLDEINGRGGGWMNILI